MGIIIGADIVPTESNIKLLENRKIEQVFDPQLINRLEESDYRIFNLEVPLTHEENPIVKDGPHLLASPESFEAIHSALNINFLTLANNHIMDQGEKGLKTTIELLKRLKIDYAGVGRNIEEASNAFSFSMYEKKIGVYCCAEHEFTIATNTKAGANPFDEFDSIDHICKLKQNSDYVIVLYHGGKEEYRYPSPLLQKRCRRMVDSGANLVICQHTHCIGCAESYNKGTIIYGQGNFLFDAEDNELWNTALLVDVQSDFTVEYIPIKKVNGRIVLAAKSDDYIIEQFNQRTNEIRREGYVEEKYKEISLKQMNRYLESIQGGRYKSLFFRIINKLSNHKLKNVLLKKYYEKQDLTRVYNLLNCEVHRECMLTALEQALKKENS